MHMMGYDEDVEQHLHGPVLRHHSTPALFLMLPHVSDACC